MNDPERIGARDTTAAALFAAGRGYRPSRRSRRRVLRALGVPFGFSLFGSAVAHAAHVLATTKVWVLVVAAAATAGTGGVAYFVAAPHTVHGLAGGPGRGGGAVRGGATRSSTHVPLPSVNAASGLPPLSGSSSTWPNLGSPAARTVVQEPPARAASIPPDILGSPMAGTSTPPAVPASVGVRPLVRASKPRRLALAPIAHMTVAAVAAGAAVTAPIVPEVLSPSGRAAAGFVSSTEGERAQPHEVSVAASARLVPPVSPMMPAKSRMEAPASSPLGGELGLIAAAEGHLHAGNPRRALDVLDQYARSFADGALQEEAVVLRIAALFAAHDPTEARVVGQAFLRAHPNSPFTAGVRALVNPR